MKTKNTRFGRHGRTIVCFLLLTALCALLLAGCGAGRKYPFKLEKNTERDAASHPYIVRTESAVWYLTQADIDAMGEEAYMAGLAKLLENQEADFADAREALAGWIWEEIPPVAIRTDFCGQAEEARYEGGYYYGDARGIRLFTDWNAAGTCLLHEYVHYLTFSCTDAPVGTSFWGEGTAEYVSKLACENRMARAAQMSLPEEELNFYLEHGAGDPERGGLDLRRFFYGTAYMIHSQEMLGQRYPTISASMMVMTQQRLEHPTAMVLSYYEAGSMLAYLIETYGKETVFSNWTIEEKNFEEVYGKSFSELYAAWDVWNKTRCDELGLVFD